MQASRSIAKVSLMVLVAMLVVGAGAVAAKAPPPTNAFVLYSGDDGVVQGFALRNHDKDEASISAAKDQLTDANGTTVGEHNWQCLESSLAWYCTGVIALTSASQQGAGMIMVAGLFEGFNGESLAITGGTGAYAGARGTVVLTFDGARFARTVKLIL